MPQDQKDFFISYTSADRQWAEWIDAQLKLANYSTIMQVLDFRAGGNFMLDIHRATMETERTIAVLSEKYQQSLFTQLEWSAALGRDPASMKRLLIPVRIDQVKAEGILAALQYIDLFGLSEEQAKEKLLADIRATMSDEPVRPKTAPNFPGHTGTTPSAVSRQPRFPGMLPAVWNVPLQRNPNFTGREEILTELHETFGASAKQIIHGLGGVGKSQIANEYCYRNAGDYDVVWWLRAENASSLATDYASLAGQKALNLPERGEQELEVIINAVRNELNHRNKWLLIFDNICDYESIKSYLPQASSGHILITSRNPDWRHVGTPHEIETWPRPESVAFLEKRTAKKDPVVADSIANELGDLPLALEQAGAYICQKQKSLAEYLADFQQFRIELWKREKPPTNYPETVATTWVMVLEAIEDVSFAKELLLFCSVVAPDNIPKSLVKSALEYAVGQDGKPAVISNFAFDDAREALCSYSLLAADTDTFSIHRLVQAVAQDRAGEDEIARYRMIMLKVLSEQFPDEGYRNPKSWPDCERLLPHAEKIAEVCELSEGLATILTSMASYHYGRALYAKATSFLQRALHIREMQLGINHPEVATNLSNLATLLQVQGKFGEAQQFYRRVLKIREEQLGSDHPDVALSLNNQATLFYDQGKYAEAETLYRRSLKVLEGQLGGEHLQVSQILNNLAVLLKAQGKYVEAESLYRRSLKIREERLGGEHPDVGQSLNNLGVLLCAQGKYAEAEPLYWQSLKIREKQLGGEHPDFAQILSNLGELLRVQRKYTEAEYLHRRALKIDEKALGIDHPSVAIDLNNLALLLDNQGKYAEAEPLFLRAVQICERSLGVSHPNTIRMRENLVALREIMSKG